MQRSLSLKKNSQFAYVFRRGTSVADRNMVVLYAKGHKLLIGFSVSKKMGNAVKRNRIKRLLRESVRPNAPRMAKGSYVIIARSGAVGADLQALKGSFEKLAARASLLK